MNWQLLVLISVLTYAISVLLQKVILKDDDSDPIAYSIVFSLLTGVVTGVFALINGFHMPNLLAIWPNILLMVFCYGVGNILIFNALKIIDASEFTILFTTRAIWTVAGALLFLGEQYTFLKAFGALLIIIGVIVVSWKSQKLRFGKGELLSLGAGALFGIAFTNDAYIVQHADVMSYQTIAFILPALAVWLFKPKSTVKMMPLLKPKTAVRLLLLAVFYSISAITVFLAYQAGHNASQIAPLVQTTTIVTVILSIIFLHERNALFQKSIGTILSFIGIILVG